jgi:EAL domain-containing protein (putative c-di-GMP-specific phosphodiesterase class I)
MASEVENGEGRRRTDSQSAMETALTPRDLSVVFQPIVDLDDGSLFAVEALARCTIPELSMPYVLFEHAVYHKYCGRLGRAIREVTFTRCSGMPMFVNIHPAELNERWLVQPDDPIFGYDHDVYLEITESVPFLHYNLCVTVLKEIRMRGHLHLVIDDLGAGFSNLKRIGDLQPSLVKLDMQLIRGIDGNRRQRMLVSSIVRLCRDMDAEVVAEGIETESELDAVLETGARYGQGYLLARPAYPIPAVNWPMVS